MIVKVVLCNILIFQQVLASKQTGLSLTYSQTQNTGLGIAMPWVGL